MISVAKNYFSTLKDSILAAQITDFHNKDVQMDRAFEDVAQTAQKTHDSGNKIMFIGNGGSAGIASHMAIDYSKNGNLRSMAFNDGAALTCLGNDLGYENVFAKQIDLHAHSGDLLIAISSSGCSENILRAVKTARERGCFIMTLSGFNEDNPLRKIGDINFYVNSNEYGFVEISHLALCHAILDIKMGWGGENK